MIGGGAAVCLGAPTFTSGIQTGTIASASIAEASGIAASHLNPNVLWTHNDSGNPANIFPMTPAGANLGTYSVTGATNTDWEDIAIGPGPVNGTQYIYVGDIGDNNAVRTSINVYRMVEPVVSDTQAPISTSIAGAAKITLAYPTVNDPQGNPQGPQDAESLFVDPLTRDIYIVTKRLAVKHVYKAAYPQATSGTTTVTLVATLNNSNWITAADISPDGNEIIMRAGATNTGLMYIRPAGGTISDAFATTPISIPLLSEVQGEAIGFDPLGRGYYTTSEGVGAPIHYFDLIPPPAAAMYWDNDGVSAGTYVTSGAGMGGTGTWSTTNKWYNGSAEVPWQNGHDAVFWGTAGTVTLGAAATVNSLSFKTNGYVVTGSTLTIGGSGVVTTDSGVTATIGSVIAGTAGLAKMGAGTLTLSGANTYSGATAVKAGKLRFMQSFITASPLTIETAAIAEVGAGLGGKLIKFGALTINGTGTLDLNDNKMIVSGGADPVATMNAIRTKIIAGRNVAVGGVANGTWDGNGITSTSAHGAFVSAGFESRVLGYALNKALPLGQMSTFGGISVGPNDILIKFTRNGDADLDGVCGDNDVTVIGALYDNGATTGHQWYQGDFNFDGKINDTDVTILGALYDQSQPPLSQAYLQSNFGSSFAAAFEEGIALRATLPEPGAAVFGVAGAISALWRRRRQS